MSVTTMDSVGIDKHPKGLYVLFATEMWERFSFYSMLALFTLYLRDPTEGFGWTAAQATTSSMADRVAIPMSSVAGMARIVSATMSIPEPMWCSLGIRSIQMT